MVDDLFFTTRHAMELIDMWEAGEEPLTFHPIDKHWLTDAIGRYTRKSGPITLIVSMALCGSWKFDREAWRCFDTAEAARRHADERFP